MAFRLPPSGYRAGASSLHLDRKAFIPNATLPLNAAPTSRCSGPAPHPPIGRPRRHRAAWLRACSHTPIRAATPYAGDIAASPVSAERSRPVGRSRSTMHRAPGFCDTLAATLQYCRQGDVEPPDLRTDLLPRKVNQAHQNLKGQAAHAPRLFVTCKTVIALDLSAAPTLSGSVKGQSFMQVQHLCSTS